MMLIRKWRLISWSVFGICCLLGCHFSVGTGSGNPLADNLEEVSSSNEPLRNGVRFQQSGGLKVQAAFLMRETGEMVNEDNTLAPDEHFKLVLSIDGWQATNGVVQVGAIEQVHDASKQPHFTGKDLFGGSGGLAEKDARVISLKMAIPAASAIYPLYQTDFKVWNKNSDQVIYGSYRFKLTSPAVTGQ